MDKVGVNLKISEDKSYEIFIGEGVLKKIAPQVAQASLGHMFAIITDSNVESLYGTELQERFERAGIDTILISFPAGEMHKNRDTKAWIEDRMLERGLGRDSAVIALGGGVVGDMAGYVAATYTRGIPYVQVPTSLVACVDSSIGGKTAIDTRHGKNLIGAFHQPWRVYIDIDTLLTLPEKEIREGIAEVIKYGVIEDRELFSFLESHMDRIFSYDKEALKLVVKRSCEIKAGVVERDEKESNLRKILNFGHTVGHAIENMSHYAISHGQAISIGMFAEGKLAVKMGLWKGEELSRLEAVIEKAGLPTDLPNQMKIGEIIKTMKLDKKARGGHIEMALPAMLGRMAQIDGAYGIRVEDSYIRDLV